MLRAAALDQPRFDALGTIAAADARRRSTRLWHKPRADLSRRQRGP
jgi:hypothetical protein